MCYFQWHAGLTLFLGVSVLPGVEVHEFLSLLFLYLLCQSPSVGRLTVRTGFGPLVSSCNCHPSFFIFPLLLSLLLLLLCFLSQPIQAEVTQAWKDSDTKVKLQSYLFFTLVIVFHKRVDYFLQSVRLDKWLFVLLNPFWSQKDIIRSTDQTKAT